ncbi:ABC transporter [Isoptericola sp. b490]|uniref:ABC transporter n=1 Tax=Actinotalea lenta TaxID=3064654 RepID=UPI0027142B55|nr:ABC transporter [Isoptericola sp. b490]MDO8121105.1 ABC transporter [Isoptericola sp. b490]
MSHASYDPRAGSGAPGGDPTPPGDRTAARPTEPGPGGADLAAGLAEVRTAVAALRLPLEVAGAAQARAEAARLTAQLDDHLLPRVRQMGAPLLAVVGGSTGAGKSTLVNSLVGAVVSPAGVLRPTTRSPVLVHHPDDAAWFAGDRVLPGLARWRGEGEGPRSLRLVAHAAVPRGLALLDAPDIDSVVADNRELGAQLLGAADLWVFCTTAARYADAVPWELLAQAAARRAAVGVVLDRLEAAERDAVSADLGRMMAEHGLVGARLLAVPEARLAGGLLPDAAAAPVRDWLQGLVADADARDLLVRTTVHGAVADLVARVPALADAADAQVAHAGWLAQVAVDAYAEATRTVTEVASDGTMLRGEVLARWQEFIGTGELLRALEAKVSSWRDRITAALRGRRAPEPVTAAIGAGLVDVVADAADRAAERVWTTWHADPAGRVLLDGLRLSRSSADLRDRVAAEVRAWQGGVLELVGTEGADRRVTARVLSFGVNGLGAALMILIFAQTGGLTGAEVGVAGGAAVLAQRLLEAIFGDDAVRRLTRVAEADLAARVDRVLRDEADRTRAPLDALDVRTDGSALRAALALVRVPDVPTPPAPPSRRERREARPERGLRAWWRRLWS